MTLKIYDAAGNVSDLSDSVDFTVDLTGPGLVEEQALNGTTGVSIYTDLRVTFDEAVQLDQVDFSNAAYINIEGTWEPYYFTLDDVRVDGSTVLFTPPTRLLPEQTYSFYLNSFRFLDLAGNYADFGDINWQFTTGAADTTPPLIAITSVGGDNRVNAAEASDGVVVVGTTDAEDGQTVTVTWGDNIQTAVVDSGAWSLTFASGDVPVDGSTTVEAAVTDIAGNTAVPASQTVLVDRLAPSSSGLPVVSVGGTPLNNGASGAPVTATGTTLTLSGTTDADNSVKIYDGTDFLTDAVVSDDGAWSATVRLTQEREYALNVVLQDAAGNLAEAGESFYVEPAPSPHSGTTAVVFDLTTGQSSSLAEGVRDFAPDTAYTIYVVMNDSSSGTGNQEIVYEDRWTSAENLGVDDKLVFVTRNGGGFFDNGSGYATDGQVYSYSWSANHVALYGKGFTQGGSTAPLWHLIPGNMRIGGSTFALQIRSYTATNWAVPSGFQASIRNDYSIGDIWDGNALA